jgi:hypothetical protein
MFSRYIYMPRFHIPEVYTAYLAGALAYNLIKSI